MPFAWDNKANADDEAFDAEVDADADLNASAAAVHSGTNGYAVTFDDTNLAYGTLDAAAVDQTQGTVEFWFNPNTMSQGASGNTRLVALVDGAGAAKWAIRYNSAGVVAGLASNDAATLEVVANITPTAGYHKYRLTFRRSSGAGNNDGVAYFYADDVLLGSKTDSDNDTIDWDVAWFGNANSSAATPAGSFYFDDCQIANEMCHSYLAEGALTFSGTQTKKMFLARTSVGGAITFAGSITKKTLKVLSGAITFIGTLAKVRIVQWIVRMKGSPVATVLMDESPDLEIEMDETPSFGIKLDNA